MGFNGDNLKAVFDQRFGKGAFDSGVNQAYQNGRNQWLAQQQALQQQMYMDQLKQQQAAQKAQEAAQKALQKDPVYKQQNAQNYFSDPSINKELHSKGAFQWVKDLQNDPMQQAKLKSAGYDVNAIADQAYYVASNGKFKSAKDFGQYFKDLNNQTQTDNKATAKQEGYANTNDWWDAKLQQAQAEKKLQDQQQLKAANDTLMSIHNDATQRQVAKNGVGNLGQELERGIARAANQITLGGLGALDKKLHGGELSPMLMNRNGAASWLDKGSDFVGSAVPFIASDGLMSGVKGLSALGESGIAGKIGQLAIRGAGSGALVGAGQEGVQAGFNPNQFDLKQALENIGIDAGVGAVANPLLHGGGNLLKQLNLKGQLAKVLENNQTQIDPEAFVKTLQEMKQPSGDFSNVLADQPKTIPNPVENPLNIQSSSKPTPTNEPVSLTTVKTGKPLNEMSDKELLQVHQLLNDQEAASVLTSKNPNRIHDINQDIANIEKEMANRQNGQNPSQGNDWFNFAQQGSNAPKARGLLPDITLPKGQTSNIRNLAEDTLNRGKTFDNAPPGGFNQRLLNVQQEMKDLQNQTEAMASKLQGDGATNINYQPDPESLYQQVRKPNDPKTFDELVKMAEMEHGANNPSLTSMLRSDPRIKQGINQLNALGKSTAQTPKVEATAPKQPKIKLPEPKNTQNPHDILKNIKINSKESTPKSETKPSGKPLLMSLNPSDNIVKSVKTEKMLPSMNESELKDTLSKLEKQEELIKKGPKGKKTEAKLQQIEEDKKKVNDFLLKLDLQTFAEKAQKKTPEEIAKEKAIAKARQEKTVKKFEDKGNPLKTEAAKDLENSDDWKNKGSFSMGRETATRVFEDVMGKDAPKMIKKYLDPIKSEEANRIRFLNEERDKVNELGIKPGSKDDELVQMYGEKKITLDELKQKAPKNWEKIVAAEKHYRGFYDNILDVANKALKENGFPEIPKRQDYFPHFQEIDGVMHQLGFDIQNHTLPTDINGLTENFRPQKSWFSNALRRTGEETDYGAAQGFDKYIEGISNVIYHTKNIKGLRALEDSVRAKYEGDTHLNNFASWIKEYTNQLAGKKAKVDRVAEEIAGRKIFNVLDTIRKRTGMNMVGANVGSALTNFIPLTQSLATTSKTAFTKGLTQTLASLGKDDGFIAKSDFLTKRFGSESLYKTWSDKVVKKSMWLMSALDHFTSNVVVRSKYNELISKGLSEKEAMKQADEWASKLMAGRSKGDLPTLMNSKTLGLFTQFQLEVNNQVSFLMKDIPRNAVNKAQLASQLGQVLIYGYLFNNLYEKATGRRPALDPIGITEQAWKDYHNDRLPQGKATTNLISNVAGQVPMGTQIAQLPMFGLDPNTSRVPAPFMASFPNIGNMVRDKGKILPELEKPATYLVLPAGGNTIKKAIEGLDAFNKGGVHNGKGQLQYPVGKNTANAVRGALFGKSSFPEAQSYYNNNESALSDKQTKMVESGIRSYQSILQDRHNSDIMKKIKEIQKGPDSPDVKAKKIASLMARIKH